MLSFPAKTLIGIKAFFSTLFKAILLFDYIVLRLQKSHNPVFFFQIRFKNSTKFHLKTCHFQTNAAYSFPFKNYTHQALPLYKVSALYYNAIQYDHQAVPKHESYEPQNKRFGNISISIFFALVCFIKYHTGFTPKDINATGIKRFSLGIIF